MKNNNFIKIFLSSSLGNILEFYDFTLYATFSSIFSPLFFPSNNPAISIIASLGIFAIGFLVRPLGAILFGHIGDRYGRKYSFNLTLICMAIPTFSIAILPTYEQIGIFAPILLTILRIIQGICAGGEFSSSAIFVLEHVSPQKRGVIGGALISSCVAGAWLSSLTGLLFTTAHLPLWSWRVAFALGGFIGFIGAYVRSFLSETKAFEQIKTTGQIIRFPLIYVLKDSFRGVLVLIGVGALNGCTIYTIMGYTPIYLQKICHLSSDRSFLASSLGLLSLIMFSPLFGKLADKTNARSIMMVFSSAVILGAFPIYMGLSSSNFFYICFSEMILGLLAAGFVGPQHLLSMNMFKAHERLSGISIGYSIGIALLGGTTPVFSTLLYEKTQLLTAPAGWLMIVASFSFLLVSLSKKIEQSRYVVQPFKADHLTPIIPTLSLPLKRRSGG